MPLTRVSGLAGYDQSVFSSHWAYLQDSGGKHSCHP